MKRAVAVARAAALRQQQQQQVGQVQPWRGMSQAAQAAAPPASATPCREDVLRRAP